MFKRIGIYPGTFDPVHTGHIAFALQALQSASLDIVYFMPERRPRDKSHVEHFAHRAAMLKQAIRPHPQFKVLELVDVSFSVERTLPKLKSLFVGDELVFLLGSDVASKLSSWPLADRLISSSEIVVGLRNKSSRKQVGRIIGEWHAVPPGLTFVDCYAPNVSSSKIRDALRLNRKVPGILSSVKRYSSRNWLYISLAVDKP